MHGTAQCKYVLPRQASVYEDAGMTPVGIGAISQRLGAIHGSGNFITKSEQGFKLNPIRRDHLANKQYPSPLLAAAAFSFIGGLCRCGPDDRKKQLERSARTGFA